MVEKGYQRSGRCSKERVAEMGEGLQSRGGRIEVGVAEEGSQS